MLNRGLLKEFPNPDRVGCPGADVLRRIASRAMPLSEADKWLDHLGSCSPCYGDFLQFQAAHRTRRKQTLLAIAASILAVASLAGWAMLRQQKQPSLAQSAVLDLRNRSLSRGGESNPTEQPRLEIPRNVSRVDIYLPLGSSDGPYEATLTSQGGEAVFTGSGTAEVKEGITSLPIDANLSSAKSGLYVLRLRKVGASWNSYPVQVK